jgi:prophage antirepressor-like protein
VKVINRDSEPFFYGSELAKMLNYARPGNALESHVSEENKIKGKLQKRVVATVVKFDDTCRDTCRGGPAVVFARFCRTLFESPVHLRCM